MFQSVAHMLFHTIQQYPDKVALRIKRNNELNELTYAEFGDRIRKLTHGLADMGLKAGDKIAILSNNRPEWTIGDFAGFCLRCIIVPIYQTLPPNQIEYILKDSETRAIFVENEMQYQKIVQIRDHLPNLKYIFSFEKLPDVVHFEDILSSGERHLASAPDFFEKSMNAIEPREICSLVYTSGTTGEPKGVMLHHHGFIIDIINAEAVFTIYAEDIFLSFLPLSHLYERLAGHWCPMYRGATIHYAQSIDTVVQDIAEAKPSVMVSVPRLYEKIANTVMEQVENSPGIKKKIFHWAMKTGMKYHETLIQGKVSRWLEKKYQIADRLAFQKIKNKLGGHFRYPIAGGAPLPVETLKFFEAMGLRIIEGYGMTETHLIISLTPSGKTRYGSCGKPINEVQVKIAADGEVLVKGDTVMAGYYKKPELTKETIDADGWLHTGDIGYLDPDNYLYLTDRKKNIIITSGGKNIAAAPLENKLKTSKYIDDICLIGNRRKFVSAIIIPNYDNLKKWAQRQGLQIQNNQELVEHPDVNRMVGEQIENLQRDFARFEQVKKFIMLSEALTIDKGELTPSLKIKRNILEEKYGDLINAMYTDD